MRVPPFNSPGEYFAFAVVGIVVFGLIRSSLSIPMNRAAGARRGHLRAAGALAVRGDSGDRRADGLSDPLRACDGAASSSVSPWSFSGCTSEWDTAALALPLALAGAFAFAPFALVFAAITLAFKQAPGQNAALAVIALASGMYFPVALLPWWLHWISEVQPFTPTVALLRHVLIGFPLPLGMSIAAAVAKIAGFIVIGIPIGVLLVSRRRPVRPKTGHDHRVLRHTDGSRTARESSYLVRERWSRVPPTRSEV